MSAQPSMKTAIGSPPVRINLINGVPSRGWELRLHRAIDSAMPLPDHAIHLGTAKTDQQPVLLGTKNTAAGAVLVTGEPHAGKTAFLQTTAAAMTYTLPPAEAQFAVITPRTWEWQPSPNCIGIFHPGQAETTHLLSALTLWLERPACGQVVFLLIDDLDELAALRPQLANPLRTLFSLGPSKRIYSIVTTGAEPAAARILPAYNFRTRILCTPGGKHTMLECEYLLQEEGGWLIFSPFA